ncbi:T3SS (YopN, CesT) and YbjN peptide-binding chaperone 1 [Allorhizocola rhizosphaerae]|uniref:T3SS (YopN, CesT) and YbjN peptide-binding chaperone 1 n=1 Tax=Allorhizocola rhizosphaerae TaxID=1872709 RepID=UPI000E3D7207|nr:hypothetical protein [Allorhizocola rhizosphaerae]
MADLPEAELLDEPTTADLGVKVTEAWREFARALASALPDMPVGSHLDVTLDPTASGTGDAVYGVSLEKTETGTMAMAIGNANLPQGYRLDRTAVAAMVALGWSPPGVLAGSGESFGLSEDGGGGDDRLSRIITRTLRDVYGAPHPAFLVYASRDAKDEQLTIPQLASARHESTMDSPPALDSVALQGLDLAERVRIVVAALTKTDPDQLQVDADGDIGIRAGSAMVFVRVRDNPPLIDVFSPVLTEVEPSEKLFVKLSELTNRMPIGRLYCTAGTVWASVPVFGRDFQATHLSLAIQVMTGLADELDDRLHGEFGGKRFFGEGDKPSGRSPDTQERIGQYL